MYIDLLKLKAYKLFENGDAGLSWLLFSKKPTCPTIVHFSFEFQEVKRVYTITWYNIPPKLQNKPRALYGSFNSCEFSNCQMGFGQENVKSSDAVVFDGRLVKPMDFFQRPLGQIWIFAAHEAPVSYEDLGGHWTQGGWVSSFNWTMTYDSSNTDIFLPYGEIRKTRKKVALNFTEIYKTKTKAALIVHSHCKTRSKRLEYLSILQKYMDVDSLGVCGRPWKCGKRYFHNDCFEIINKYKFYLSFENAFCHQYFTEKLFENFNYNSIMITRGGLRKDTKHSLPDGTYISTEDFKSIKSLADYLIKVSNSESLYTELLRNKSQYTSIPYETVYQRAMCNLCERMNKQDRYRKSIPNIVNWAYSTKPCRSPLDLIET